MSGTGNCRIEISSLTLKHRETHGCVVSTVATDALVLKHQAITIHNADETFIVLDQFHKWPSRLRVKIDRYVGKLWS